MKITGIEIKQYAKPLDPSFLASWDPNPRVKFASTIVYVHTDEGITGIGSGDLMTGFAGHEKFFIGKKCGQPIYKLLGGKQDKMKAYCSCGARISAEERDEKAKEYVKMGFKAMKSRFHHEEVREDIEVVEAVRKAIGDQMEIMVDGNQAWKMSWDVERIRDLKKALKVAEYLEYPFDPPVWTVERRDYIIREEDRVLVDQDGYMHVPQKPGLGFAPDEEALKEYEIKDFYIGE